MLGFGFSAESLGQKRNWANSSFDFQNSCFLIAVHVALDSLLPAYLANHVLRHNLWKSI